MCDTEPLPFVPAMWTGYVDGAVRVLRVAQRVEQADGVGQPRLVGIPPDVVEHRQAVVQILNGLRIGHICLPKPLQREGMFI